MPKLNVKAVGLSCGIIWSVSLVLMGFMSIFFNWGTGMVDLLSSLYIGYKPTLLGSITGGIWGFFDGLIGGLLFAWLYNKLAK